MAEHNHHHHHHDHENHSQDNTSWTERNRSHWDKAAATYNSNVTRKEWGDLINKLNAFIIQNLNWLGVPFLDPSSEFETKDSSPTKSVRILDYACGPGTVTAALAGYATEYVGMDLSEKMVEQYNHRFNPSSNPLDNFDSSITPQELNAHAINADLLDPKGVPASVEAEKYYNFDLAAVSGGFHHFENVELATRRLADRLRPGGVLMIFDFLTHAPHDMNGDPALNTVVHHGFTEARVHELFEGAGLTDVEVKVMPGKVLLKGKAERQGFLAKGKKPE